MYTLYGYEQNNFVTKDGKSVTGYWFYLARQIDPKRGSGCAIDRQYVSQNKLPNGQLPVIGSQVEIFYNKFGKVASVSVTPPRK